MPEKSGTSDERTRCAGTPPLVRIGVDHTILPVAFAPHLPKIDFTTGSLYRELATAGIILERSETSIEARVADPDLAAHLDLKVGNPILVLDQVVYDRALRAILVSTVRYSGERYRLHTTFIRTP